MSSAEETELKAGHPPAVKAGGMRIARTHRNSASEKTEPAAAENKEENEQFEAPAKKQEKANIVIAGAVMKGDKEFTPEAVRQFHEKPLPSKEKPHFKVQTNIQQPR